MRDMRKAPNGTSEGDVLQFYGKSVDYLAITSRVITQSSPRFIGWRNYLAIVHFIQSVTFSVDELFMNYS